MMDFIADSKENNEALLLYDIRRKMGAITDRRIDHLNLTRPQWKLLMMLRRNEGIRQAQLAKILDVEPIVVVRQINRLEAKGWLERRSDPGDLRANKVYLTPRVAGMMDELAKIALQVRRDTMAGFSAEEHRLFVEYLTRIDANLASAIARERKEYLLED